MKNILHITAGIAMALFLVGCGLTRGGYESAPYTVVSTNGKFEVRDYPTLTVVETPMVNDKKGADSSFTRLFDFITGNNKTNEKISMTTPVLMSGSGDETTMAFVLPASYKKDEVPTPTNKLVNTRELAAGSFAVMRFSGSRNAENEAAALTLLKNWMAQEKLTSTTPPVYGYFDPPWTPGFLRRNEVMLKTN